MMICVFSLLLLGAVSGTPQRTRPQRPRLQPQELPGLKLLLAQNSTSRTRCLTGPARQRGPCLPARGWTEHSGFNCYSGHGCVKILPNPWSRTKTQPECEAACVEETGCQGIIRSAKDASPTFGLCYLLSNIMVSEFVHDSNWNTFTITKGKFSEQKHVNCSTGHGAIDIGTNPYTTTTLEDCKNICVKNKQCTAILYAGSRGYCYLRIITDLGACLPGDPRLNLYKLDQGTDQLKQEALGGGTETAEAGGEDTCGVLKARRCNAKIRGAGRECRVDPDPFICIERVLKADGDATCDDCICKLFPKAC